MFTLKADSTFDYVVRTNAGTVSVTKQGRYGIAEDTTANYIFSDSSYGNYTILNDTVFLNYATKEVAGDFNGFNVRPVKLYWAGKSLYYIQLKTNNVLRWKEHHMTWNKGEAPNLSKADETYSERSKGY